MNGGEDSRRGFHSAAKPIVPDTETVDLLRAETLSIHARETLEALDLEAGRDLAGVEAPVIATVVRALIELRSLQTEHPG
ncbi:MAG: hypothetical protein SynsKO_31570 [Synoicihabitans sp.]